MPIYAVVGATGNTGAATARALLADGHEVRVLVRDASRAAGLAELGAEVIEVDLSDVPSLRRGFERAAGAYLLNPPAETMPDPLRRAMQIADALARALDESQVGHAVVLSSIGAQFAAGTGLILTTYLTEQRLSRVSARITFMRCAFFLENWLSALPAALTSGTLRSELQVLDQRHDFVGSADIGATAAGILTGAIPFSPVVELAGARAWSPSEVAAALARAAGVSIRAEAVPRSEWVSPLRQHGLSDAAIDGFVEMYDAFNEGNLVFDGAGTSVRGTQSLDDWASAAVAPHRRVDGLNARHPGSELVAS